MRKLWHAGAVALGLAFVPAAHAAVSATLSGTQLQITLGSPGDQGRVDQSTSNILVIDDSTSTTIFNQPAASIDSISVTGIALQGQTMRLAGVETFGGDVTVTNVDTVLHQGFYQLGAGSYSVTGAVQIQMSTSTAISTSSGNITLTATSASPTNGVSGLTLTSASISTVSGTIALTGKGDPLGVLPNAGIELDFSGVISSGTGSITMNGQGGGASIGGPNSGVLLNGTTVESLNGPVLIQGTGGVNGYGVAVTNGSLVLGTGSGIASIEVDGTSSDSDGVTVNDSSSITTVNGDLTIQGSSVTTGGSGSMIFSSPGGAIHFIADSLAFPVAAAISAPTVNFTTLTPGFAISVGGTNTGTQLGLDSATLATVSTPNLLIGGPTTTGPLQLGGISSAGGWTVLNLETSGPFVGGGAFPSVPNVQFIDTSTTDHTWTGNGFSLQEDANTAIDFGGAALAIGITGGGGSATFVITPNPLVTYTVIGGPTPLSIFGNTLTVANGGQLNPAVTATSSPGPLGLIYSGSETFSNMLPISFSNIQTGSATFLAVNGPSVVTAGATNSFAVTTVDQFHNFTNRYGGQVTVTSTDPGATLPAFINISNGQGSGNVILTTAGTQTVSAVDSLFSFPAGTSSAITVVAGGATHFAVVAPSTEIAGSPLTVTVTALDAFNNVATSASGPVTVTSSDAGAILPAITLVNGTGTGTVTLTTAGSQVVSVNGNPSGTITVSPASATRFTVTVAASVTAGTPASIAVTALDAFNNAATGYAGSVHFTSSDGQAVLPANSALTAGIGFFSGTLKTAGSQMITATDSVNSSINGTSGAIVVTPGAATHFLASAPSTATAGTSFSFTVTALDAFNNTATSYAGAVHFSSSDGLSVLPANSILSAGAGTFSATLQTAGSQTITATDSVTSSITGTTASIAVGGAAPTHFTVAVPGTASSGTPSSFTVTALDAFNNIATGYAGSVHFSSSDAQAVLPANSTLTNGTGTFSATLKTLGSQTITATDTVNAGLTATSGPIVVAAGAATHFSLGAPGTASAGTAFSITVTALDASGNTATGYSGSVHFSSTDGTSTLPANSSLTSGVGTFSATLNTSGSQTITATDSVSSSITGTSGAIVVSAAAATHFAVSAPATAASGTAFSFTVTALDQFNNTATAYGGTVHFTTTDAGVGVSLPANSTLTSGVGTFSATLKTSGSQTISATDAAASSITGTSGTISVSFNTYAAPSATGTGTITATFTGGGATCAFSTAQFIDSPPGSTPVPPTLPAANVRFPQGMFDYSLTGCTPGSTITMTITYPQPVTGARYYKYGPEASNPLPHWYALPTTVSGNTLTVSIVDGGQGDDDLAANGVIADPGGPGFPPAANVPTLSDWMLALLALGVGALGLTFHRRDHRPR